MHFIMLKECDLLIYNTIIVTLNQSRHVIKDGAIAIKDSYITEVGKTAALKETYKAKRNIDGSNFLITPGFVNGHIHITGDPLTHSFARGPKGISASDKLMKWVMPLYKSQTPQDEAISAKLSAINMLKSGTTLFLEAGTVIHLDDVMDSLSTTGIRGRVGKWVEGRAYSPNQNQKVESQKAIAILEDEIAKYPDNGKDTLLAAWPVLVGHSTNPDDVWLAAKSLADSKGLKVSAHMSPRVGDSLWFKENTERLPLEHLYEIGALGENVCITHLAVMEKSELEYLIETKTNAIHCPWAAYPTAQGVSVRGYFPEMLAAGVNVMLGTDGSPTDILTSARLMASVARDARFDADLINDGQIIELATINGARAMGMENYLGSLEAGKKADFVLHDISGPDWDGIFDPIIHLALGANPANIHSVYVNGLQVVDNGHCTFIDEEKTIADARQASRGLVAKTGLVAHNIWPII